MNPATVKQILGEKSVLAMYRDCLKVVPLMNPSVRFFVANDHFRQELKKTSKDISDSPSNNRKTRVSRNTQSSRKELCACSPISRSTKSKSNYSFLTDLLLGNTFRIQMRFNSATSMFTTRKTNYEKKKTSRQHRRFRILKTCLFFEITF